MITCLALWLSLGLVDRMLMLEDVVLLGGYVTELDLGRIKVNKS